MTPLTTAPPDASAAVATRSSVIASATTPSSATIVSANTPAPDSAAAPLHDLPALVVGDLVLEVAPPSDRKTIEIVVERDASLVLKAPPTATIERAKQFVTAKRPWVYRKLAEKDALTGPPVVKQFVEGEGFAYLGRSYRLTLTPDAPAAEAVRLERGRFHLPRLKCPRRRHRHAPLVHPGRRRMAPPPRPPLGIAARRGSS